MLLAFLALDFVLLGFTLSNTSEMSLDIFRRGVPSPQFNISRLTPLLERPGHHVDPQYGWPEGVILESADEDLWCKAVAKGVTLLEAMSYSDADAGKTFMPPRHSARSLWSLGLLLTFQNNKHET